ncbi:MAG: PEP-CTERM sorting domain-containing protein [Fimbriimonadaceae bacterium]|nr:PEP-CTERM sorting domain-containing protein [Fimbriimonadaceae bacterium]
MRKTILLAMSLAFVSSAFGQNLYSNQSSNVNVAQLNAVSVTRSGVAAAAGSYWSECQSNGSGVQTESNTTGGFSVYLLGTTSFRIADDFTVAAGGWSLTGVKVYAYQTGSTSNPFTGGDLNIWSGRPGDAGSSIVGTGTFGSVTNSITVFDSTGGLSTGGVFRIFNTNSPAPGTAPGTTRQIREVTFNVANLNLTGGGTYWIDYQLAVASGTGFSPPATYQDLRNNGTENGRQRNGTAWTDLFDAGNPATAADVLQDAPFILTGQPVPEPATIAALGLGAMALIRRRRK